MRLLKHLQLTAVLVALVVSLSALAASVEVGGVKLDDNATVGGTALQLNGAGVRYKAVFKVYAAGLYLSKKAATPEDVMSAAGPKRISVTMLRDIDPNELGKLFLRGVEDNAPKAESSKLVPGLVKTGQIFSGMKKLVPGDTFTIDWIPGTGTVFSVKGVAQLEPVKEPEYYNALIRIWLGPNPADWKLKEALLGKAS